MIIAVPLQLHCYGLEIVCLKIERLSFSPESRQCFGSGERLGLFLAPLLLDTLNSSKAAIKNYCQALCISYKIFCNFDENFN